MFKRCFDNIRSAYDEADPPSIFDFQSVWIGSSWSRKLKICIPCNHFTNNQVAAGTNGSSTFILNLSASNFVRVSVGLVKWCTSQNSTLIAPHSWCSIAWFLRLPELFTHEFCSTKVLACFPSLETSWNNTLMSINLQLTYN